MFPGITDLVDSDRKQIILARHHFPIALYKRTISPKITTLLSDVQMGIVAESDVSDRLRDEMNRVRSMARKVRKILKPGPLLEAFIRQENECLEELQSHYVRPPLENRMEVLESIKAFTRIRKRTTAKATATAVPASTSAATVTPYE
jgi:hypothetical protein